MLDKNIHTLSILPPFISGSDGNPLKLLLRLVLCPRVHDLQLAALSEDKVKVCGCKAANMSLEYWVDKCNNSNPVAVETKCLVKK